MRTTLIAAIAATLSLQACAQTAPSDPNGGVHASPSVEPTPAPRSWRRVPPTGDAGRALEALQALIAGERTIDDVFAPSFFEHTPRMLLEQNTQQIREGSGGEIRFVRTLRSGDDALGVELVDANGAPLTALIGFDAQGQISALQLTPQRPRPEGAKVYDTWSEVLADVRALEGDVSFATRRVGVAGIHAPIALRNEDETLNVAQLGQVFLLGGAALAVESGEASWDDEIPMAPRFRSLPPSQYAQTPDGEAHTLGDYLVGAGALRDSAASDAVLHAIGRERVREYYESVVDDAPPHAYPWLSVRDYALLKLFSSDEGRERYAQNDEEARRATLAGVPADADLSVDQAARIAAWQSPRSIERIGWFASADDLVRTLADLAERSSVGDAMAPLEDALLAKAGVPLSSEAWPAYAYKAGGEPGVFALATLLRRADGVTYALVMLLNDAESLPDWREAERIAIGAIDLLTLED